MSRSFSASSLVREKENEGESDAPRLRKRQSDASSRSYPTTPPKRKGLTREELEQLIADIEAGKILPIPDRPPRDMMVGKKKRVRTAPGGQGVTLPGVWNRTIDPTGYYVCELFDGIRVFWSGDGVLATRHGRKIDVPAWWAQKLPKGMELDGELWLGHNKLGKLTSSAFLLPNAWQKHQDNPDMHSKMQNVSKDDVESHWKDVKFMVLDVPDVSLKFEDRLAKLEEMEENDVVQIVKHEKCEGESHLLKKLEAAVAGGSEGLLLRDAGAVYKYGNAGSTAMMRVKKIHEAEVLMVEKSKTTRGLLAQVPSGKQQMVRCTKHEYDDCPPQGTVLTVGHFGQWEATGRYKYPFLLNPRHDLKWTEVVERYNSKKATGSK